MRHDASPRTRVSKSVRAGWPIASLAVAAVVIGALLWLEHGTREDRADGTSGPALASPSVAAQDVARESSESPADGSPGAQGVPPAVIARDPRTPAALATEAPLEPLPRDVVRPLLARPLQVRLRAVDHARQVLRARYSVRDDDQGAWRLLPTGRFEWPGSARESLRVRAEKQGWGRAERVLRRDEYDGSAVTLMLARDVVRWGVAVDAKGRFLQEANVLLAPSADAPPAERSVVVTDGSGRFPLPDELPSVGAVWLGRLVELGRERAFVPGEVLQGDPLRVRRPLHSLVPVRLPTPPPLRWVSVAGSPGALRGVVEIDADGTGWLALPGEGPVTLRASCAGLQSPPVTVTLTSRRILSPVEFVLDETRVLGGVVTDAHGAPLAGVWITVLRPGETVREAWPAASAAWARADDVAATDGVPGEPPPGTVASHADGAFYDLPYRPGTLVAYRPGWRPATRTVDAAPGPLALRLDDGIALALEVTLDADASESPDGLRVELARLADDPADPVPLHRASLDATGRAALAGLAPGPHALRVLRGDELLAEQSVDPGASPHLALRVAPTTRVRLLLPDGAPSPRALRLVPRDASRAPVLAGVDDEGLLLRVPWTGAADLERLAAQDEFLARCEATWLPVAPLTVGTRDLVRALDVPARGLEITLDAPAARAPFVVALCDPMRPGAPLVASARVGSGERTLSFDGLPAGFLRIDLIEAPSGLREGGAFVGQRTTAVPERGVRAVDVPAHDGARVALAVRVTDPAGAPLAGVPLRARLSRTVLAEGTTGADGGATLDVPNDVRGVVEALDATGTPRAPATPYQSPGRREVLLRLPGEERAGG